MYHFTGVSLAVRMLGALPIHQCCSAFSAHNHFINLLTGGALHRGRVHLPEQHKDSGEKGHERDGEEEDIALAVHSPTPSGTKARQPAQMVANSAPGRSSGSQRGTFRAAYTAV